MKKSILLSLIALMMVSLNAATYRVTSDASGGGDGQSWDSPMTIAEAMAAAKADEDTDDIILCKAGTYTPTATIAISTPMTVRGGLKGTDDETLAENGERSVFDTQNNTAITAIFSVTTASGLNTFEGVEVRNAYFRGFNKSGAGSLSFLNCVFDACGKKYKTETTLRGSAGCFLGAGSATITFENCVFSRNSYELSNGIKVGNGIALAFQNWKRVMIDNSLFVSNGLGRAALKSSNPPGGNIKGVRGAAIYTESPLTVRNTEFRANTAGIHTGSDGAMGGIVYIKEAKGLSSFTNCLFLANSCEQCSTYGATDTKEAGVLVVRSASSSTATKDSLDVVNCTFAYNFTDGKITSAGVDVGSYAGTKANIKNTIFYGARKFRDPEKGRDIWVSSSCSANIDYCLFDSDGEENIEKCIAGEGTKTIGSNNVFGDPKFKCAITAEEIDSIMVSNKNNTVWYYGYAADAYENVFSKANVHAKSRKLTVDKGDPASPYSNEPTPNGKRVNLGYYGNTPEALSTVIGMRVIIR